MNVFIFAGRVDVRYTAVMRYGVRQITAQSAHARAVAKVLCGNSRGSDDSLFTTMHSPATTAATASSVWARAGKFNAAFCLSRVCVFYG